MLAGNEGRLVRRVTAFYDGDRFERDLVSISGVTTYVERIPRDRSAHDARVGVAAG